MDEATLHAVKTAALSDTLKRYGLRGADALKRVGTQLFSAHPLPTYQSLAQTGNVGKFRNFETVERSGYGPGAIDSLRSALTNGSSKVDAAKAFGRGLANNTKTIGHFTGELAREMTLGSPITEAAQLKKRIQSQGVLGGLGSQVKDFYAPSHLNPLKATSVFDGVSRAGMLALSAGMPAMQMYDAATGDPNTRGHAIGGAIGSALTTPFTMRLGIPGMVVQGLGQNLGARVGGLFDRPPYSSAGESSPKATPATQPPLLRP